VEKVTKVILDVLGGDTAPNAQLMGAIKALKQEPEMNLVLVGNKQVIDAFFDKHAEFKSRIEVVHTTTNIEMNEQPTQAIRNKPDSAIVMGLELVRDRKDCVGFISAGNTGALMTGAIMKIGRIAGVSRPALCPTFPTVRERKVLVLDVGANMDCKPINLVHFALMADVYLKQKGLENPRIGLLNLGTEEEKGNELTKETFQLLKKMPINFAGHVEARETFSGDYDAIITDGFAGNVLLKSMEGCGKLYTTELKKAMKGFPAVIGKLILAPRLLKMKKRLHEDAAGGAILLGIKKPVTKIHGNASPTTVSNALVLSHRTGDMNLEEKIGQALKDISAD